MLLGLNPFAATSNFLLDRASLSPNGDGNMDCIDLVHTYMLRNAETFRYEVIDADTGDRYFVQDIKYVGKAVQNTLVSFYQPVGAEPWSAMEPWGGEELADGTHCILRMTAYMQSSDPFDPAANENAVWQVPVTIDRSAPELTEASIEGGTLSISVTDNHYTAFIGVYSDASCTEAVYETAVEETSRGAVTGVSCAVGGRDRVYVKLCDYAGNIVVTEVERQQTPILKGDCDLNGVVQAGDALLALRHALGLITLEGEAFTAGDLDGDGTITAAEALQILRCALGLVEEL